MQLRNIFPQSNTLTAAIWLLPVFPVLVVTVSLLICDRMEGCGQQMWNSDIWKEPLEIGFCEKDTPGTALREEQNALSNFGFVYFGLVVLGLAVHDSWKLSDLDQQAKLKSHVTTSPFLSLIYGSSMIYLGIGSFFFHGYGSDIAYAHDQASILTHMLIMDWFGLLLFLPLNYEHSLKIKSIGIFASLVTIILMIRANIREDIKFEDVFPYYYGLVGSFLALLVLNTIFRKLMNLNKFDLNQLSLAFATGISFICAFTVQEDFIPVTACKQTSRFQFHALWHVIAGFGFFVLYFFFRADHQPKQEDDSNEKSAEVGFDKQENASGTELA